MKMSKVNVMSKETQVKSEQPTSGLRKFGFCVDKLCWLIFIIVAGYWIYKVCNTYYSEPLSSTVTMRRNQSFAWPSISICPVENDFNWCYDQETLLNLSAEYSLPVGKKNWNWVIHSHPFNFTQLDWKKYNASNILKTVMKIDRRNFVTGCTYNLKDGGKGHDCMNDSSDLGQWKTYSTRGYSCYEFKPTPTTNAGESIDINMDVSKCGIIQASIHSAQDTFYKDKVPIVKKFRWYGATNTTLSLKVQEFDNVNTRASPCIADADYSETECFEMKIREHIIQKAGCYFAAVTGYSQNYTECNNATAYYKLMNVAHEVFVKGQRGKGDAELEAAKDTCLPRCHQRMYVVVKEDKIRKRSYGKSIFLTVDIALDGMYIWKVEEALAMPLDVLVANVGGIIGIFLGLSFTSAVNAVIHAGGTLRNLADVAY